MPRWTTLLVPVLLASQGLLVFWSARTERPPAPPPLAQFPASLDGWKELHDDPVDPDMVNTLRADRLLSRTYVSAAGNGRTPGSVELLVAWFQSQRAGASQPHSPKVCLPASGWAPVSTGEMTISTSAGEIDVNRYVVADRTERAVILYWYQSYRRAVAGEWASKFWLVADALRDHRTDTALVRIVVENSPAGDEPATSLAANFARAVYPLLRQRLPQ
jgi:EpsI family protein